MINGRIVKQTTGNQLPEVGKIKIGMKSDKGFPTSLDYFRPYGKYEKFFTDAFGEKPDKIQIIFISDDPSYSCNQRYELRNSKGDIYGKGDGEHFQIWDAKSKSYGDFKLSEHADLMSRSELKAGGKWKVKVTLRFIILKVNNILGIWSLETAGEASSVKQLVGAFDFVRERAGTVTRISFDLCVKKHKSQKPDDPSSYPVLSLIPNISDENLLLLRNMRDTINFGAVNFLDDTKLLQLQQDNNEAGKMKEIPASFTEVKEGKKDNKLFEYET